jgi:diguanylate cyclase
MTPALDLQTLLSPAPLAVILSLAATCGWLAARLRRAHRRIEELALTDTLTGLGSRRLLELQLPRELARARRAGLWLFVGVADVDRLEPLNRAAGRPAGHALLAGIAAVLRGALRRAGDHAFRDKGDRFLFAFASEHAQDGMAMAERIRTRVEELATPHPDNAPHGRATVSVGLVTVPPSATVTLPAVEERCAEALAVAVRDGRNRTVGLGLEAP